MIFKTFDSKIDKWTAKIGIFGKSFNKLGTAVNDAFKSVIDNIDNFDENVGFWESLKNNLFSKKKDRESQLIDVIPEINPNDISDATEEIKAMVSSVSKNKTTWQEWFDTLPEGKKHLVQLGQQMESQIITTEGVTKANQSAREAAIAHNEALKQQTLGAKAGKIAMQGLAMAGNMAAGMLISFAISKTIEGIYNLIHADEQAIEASNNAKEAISNLKSEAQQTAEAAKEAGQEYSQLAQGINQIDNTNTSLSTDEYEKYLDLSNQLAELFPTLIRGYDDQGNAILNLGGNMDEINEKIQNQIDKKKELNSLEQYQAFMGEGVDENGNEREDGYYTGAKIKVDNIADSKKDTEDQINNLQKKSATFTPGTKENDSLKNLIANKNIDWGEKRDRVAGFLRQEMEPLGLNNEEREKYENVLLKKFDESDEEFNEDTLYEIQEFLNGVIYKKQQELNGFNASLNQQNVEISQNAQAVLEHSLGYSRLTDNQKKLGKKIFNNIQWDKATTEYGDPVDNEEEAEQYIQNFSNKLSKMDDKNFLALEKLFSLNYEDMPVDEARQTIEKYLKVLGEQMDMSFEDARDLFGFGDFFELGKKYDNVVSYATNSKGFNKQDVVNTMKDNSINTDEEISKFKESLEKAATLDEALKTYLSSTAQQTDNTILSFSDAWEKLGTSDKTKDTKEQLLELAEAGKLTVKSFNQTKGSKTFLGQIDMDAEEAVGEINNLVDRNKQLSSLRTGISAIRSAYEEKKENKRVGADTFEGMEDTFSGLGNVWENYKTTLGSDSSSLEECKKAQNELAAAYVNSNNFLSQLTDTNKDYYISVLDEMGVENAAQIVTNELNKQKINAKIATFDLKNTTRQEIDELGAYISSLDESSQALGYYALQQQIANNNALDTSDGIKQLKLLAKQCGITGEAISLMSSLAEDMKTVKYYTTGNGKNDKNAGNIISSANSEINGNTKRLKKIINKGVKVGTSPKINSQNPSGSNNKNNAKTDISKSKETIDWISRRLEVLQSKIDLTKAKFENLFRFSSKNNNLNTQIKQSTKLMNAYEKAAAKYKKKAQSINLSSGLKKKVQNGDVTGNLSQLISAYGEKTAQKIQTYQDYWDKYQDAHKNKLAQKTTIRELKEQKYQNYVDRAEANISLYEQQKENATNASDKNSYLDKEIKQYRKSYEYQIKIAKLTKDTTKQKRLQAELEAKLREIEKEKLENTEEQQQAQLNLIQAQKERAVDYSSKNSNIDTEIAKTNELYDTQIAIANLERNTEEAQKLQIEREQQLIALQKEKFDNIAHQHENQRKLVDNSYQDLSNAADELEARGLIVGASLYSSQIDLNNAKKAGYEEELHLLESQLPNIEQGTDEWYGALDAIQTCKDGIADATKNTIELNKAVREIPFLINEKINSRLELISSEFDLIIKYMSNKKLTDDGTFTKEGTATLAAYYSQLLLVQEEINGLKPDLDDLWDKIQRGEEGYTDPAVLDEFYEKYPEYIDLKNTEYDMQQNLIDMMKDKYEAELDYLQELIDKRKELLQAEKDAYDYQRTIEEKSNTISTLKKQLNAVSGDDSEEGRMRRQQLLVSLDEAQKDLQDTEYNQWISDQQEMLDNLYHEYADFMDNHLNDVEGLLDEAVTYLKDPETQTEFLNTWDTYMSKYDFQPENDLKCITDMLGEGGSIVAGIRSVKDSIEEIYVDYLKNQNYSSANTNSELIGYDDTPTSASASVTNAPVFTGYVENNGVSYDVNTKTSITAGYVKSLIDKYSQKAGQSKSNYGKLNQYIYEKTGGKIVPNRYFPYLAEGFDLPGSASQDEILKVMKDAGYSSGGIADYLQKVPRINGDDGWVTLKKGEGILTPEQTKQFQKLAENLDLLNPSVHLLDQLSNPDLRTAPNPMINQSMGDIQINMSLPGVTNYEEFRQKMQSDPKMEKMFKSMIWDKGNLSKYNISM